MENLNAEQVKKALECCSSSDGVSACESGCPYWGGDYDTCPCIEEPNFIIKNALALIKELTEENERLTRLANLRQRDLDNANDLLFKLEDENERLKAQKYYIHSDDRIEMIPTVESVKADTVSEMQTRVAVHFGTYTDKDTVKISDVFKAIAQIAKEMVEGKNE